MADGNETVEDVKKLVADMRKQMLDLTKQGEDAVKAHKEALDKQVADLVQKGIEAKEKAMNDTLSKHVDSLRKGVYAADADDEVQPSHSQVIEKSDNPKVQAFQRWNDTCYILSKACRTPVQNLKVWRDQMENHSELRKAMSATVATNGLEWVPTEFSAELIERVRLALKVAALFPMIDMPSNPYKLPVGGAEAIAYLVSEATTDDPATRSFTPSTPKSESITLDAKKLGARTPFSEEATEDSIIPVVEFIKNRLAIAMAFAREDAIQNGDTTATHMDGDVTDAKDARKAWKGLRRLARVDLVVDLSTLSVANIRQLRGNMGKYGGDPSKLVFMCGPKTYVKLLGLAEVITVDKYGQNATILSGELAKLDGIPIIVSEKGRDDLDANGFNAATTNNKGGLQLTYVPAFIQGQRRKVTLKSFDDVQNDQSVLVTSWRGDFKALYDTNAEPVTVRGRNITT